MAMHAVPFTLDNVWAGFGHVEGLLHDEGGSLCFEYRLKDAIVGALRSEVKQLRVPLKDLVSVSLTKGWLGNNWLGVKIVIQTARMDVLEDMPGASQGRIVLKISGKDSEAAEAFVANLHQQDEKPIAPRAETAGYR